jgi:hypothetical protein
MAAKICGVQVNHAQDTGGRNRYGMHEEPNRSVAGTAKQQSRWKTQNATQRCCYVMHSGRCGVDTKPHEKQTHNGEIRQVKPKRNLYETNRRKRFMVSEPVA